MKQQIDTGGLTFSRMREENVYFVDKSMLIADILSTNGSGVYLFTRPRRFGKTTNLTMLDAFFNLQYKGNTWFDGLEISNHPEFDRYRNAFPVININLKKTKADTFSSFVNHMRSVLNNTFDRFRYLLKSDLVYDDEKDLFDRVLKRSIEEDFIIECVPTLCRMLERHHGVKPIILIDEYDRAVSDSFGSESHRPMMNLLGGFMCEALKNNDSLQMAYVTGIMQIAKESIFSDLNNIRVNNIFSIKSDERFGFTEAEVKKILADYGHPEKFEEAKSWYDGYRFGDAEVYNPFSIMSYVSEDFKPESFWANSGGDWIIKTLLKSIDDQNYSRILDLTTGGSMEVELRPAVTYSRIGHADSSLYSLMAMSGYLKAVPKENDWYEVSIPNREVLDKVRIAISDVIACNDTTFKNLVDAVRSRNADGMEKAIQNILIGGSYLNLVDENSYILVVMTLLRGLMPDYDVKTEVEQGNGRTDLFLRPLSSNKVPMILEFKKVDSEKDLVPATEDAIRQIREKRYTLGMPTDTVLIGMAFWGKIPKVLIEAADARSRLFRDRAENVCCRILSLLAYTFLVFRSQ